MPNSDISIDNSQHMVIVRPKFDRIMFSATAVTSQSERHPRTTFSFLTHFTTASGFANSFDNDLSFHKYRHTQDSLTSEQVTTATLDFDDYLPPVSLGPIQRANQRLSPSSHLPTRIIGYDITTDGSEIRDIASNWDEQPIDHTHTEDWLSSQPYHRPSSLSVVETKSTAYWPHWHSNSLALKANEIVSRIKEVTVLKSRNSAIPFEWSAFLEERCLNFFSPSNLHKFLDMYWISWYPHWPVIHKPTFVAAATPCTLLATMVLIGASYSPEITDRNKARAWFNAVEEMVFSDDYFSDSSMIPESHDQAVDLTQRRLRALQAAHGMCLCQAWEGDRVSKKRARHHRFSAVVAMARDLSFAQGKHDELSGMKRDNFRWREFLAREEMIRTLIYVFVLDSGFVIFNNMPPRLVIQEGKTSLVCPEAIFQAPTAAECFTHVKAWTSHRLYKPNVSLSAAIDALCLKDLDHETQNFFAEVGSINLLIIAAVFNSIAFHLSPALGRGAQLAPLRHAISHWGVIWTSRPEAGKRSSFGTPSNEPNSYPKRSDMWKRVGFMKHAHEFWMLFRIVVERFAAGEGCSPAAETDSHAGGFAGSPAAYILDRYDDTSMDHLRMTILAATTSQLNDISEV